MKVLRGALISTGIGAIIVLLGSLIAYFTSTQEGVDKVARVTTKLKVGFDTLLGVFQKLGKAFKEGFSGFFTLIKEAGKLLVDVLILPIKQLIGVVKGLGSLLSGDFKGAWEDVSGPVKELVGDSKEAYDNSKKAMKEMKEAGKSAGEAFKSAGEEMREALKRAERISEINEKLAASEADFIEQTGILKQQFKEQNRIAEDTTKTFQEREEAARKSIEIQRSINKLAKDRNNLEQELLNLKFASNDTSDADRAELAKKKAELAEQTAAMLEAETTQNNKVNTIHKAMLDEQKKQREEANKRYTEMLKERLAAEKQAIDVYVESNSAVAKSLQERLQIEEKGMNDRLAVLEEERKKGLVSRREYEAQKRKLEQDFAKTKIDLSVNAVQQELAMYEQMNQSKIAKEGRLTAEIVTQEQQRQAAIYQMKVEALEKEKQLKEEANQWDYAQQRTRWLCYNSSRSMITKEWN